jgi:Dyp-type peroxidase family
MESDPAYLDLATRRLAERRYIEEKRRQPGVAFPSATTQEHLLIIRFNVCDNISGNSDKDKETVRTGLRNLCGLLEKIAIGEKKIEELSDDGYFEIAPLSKFKFSATMGFGIGFFKKLDIIKRNWPKNLKAMPSYSDLGDALPYVLSQTDFIIQLGADDDYINRWVFQNQVGITRKKERRDQVYGQPTIQSGSQVTGDEDPPDIYTAIKDWAIITDIHAGFQRIDGRNLLGFNDGISNPFRLSNNVIWTTSEDEDVKFQDGTYMVFQKIEHDLEKWQNMYEEKQELWIGRSKDTGLLLGTLPKDEDRRLASDMRSRDELICRTATKKWKKLYNQQKFPETRFYDPAQTQFRGIQLECPVWSHVRKANPRQADGAAKILIFRRGYLFIEGKGNSTSNTGLLFICFQRNIDRGFEYIKKNFLNNKNFPVPQQRKNFNSIEVQRRHQHGRLTVTELQRLMNGSVTRISPDPDSQSTGNEGLSGPSELGVYPQGEIPITVTLGGGYYFIPPIPKKKISNICEQFFD